MAIASALLLHAACAPRPLSRSTILGYLQSRPQVMAITREVTSPTYGHQSQLHHLTSAHTLTPLDQPPTFSVCPPPVVSEKLDFCGDILTADHHHIHQDHRSNPALQQVSQLIRRDIIGEGIDDNLVGSGLRRTVTMAEPGMVRGVARAGVGVVGGVRVTIGGGTTCLKGGSRRGRRCCSVVWE